MNMLKKYGLLIIVAGIAVLLVSPKGNAQTFSSDGNPGDTVSGEVINALATYETLNYEDANSNTKPTTYPATDLNFTTSPEYGFSMDTDVTDANTVIPGQNVQEGNYFVTNEGNAALNVTLEAIFSYGGSASNWIVELWHNVGSPALIGTMAANTLLGNNVTLAEDTQDTGYYYDITVSTNVSEAPDGGYVDVYTTFESAASETPVGTYEGANGYIYGGTSEADDYFKEEVSAPEMVITRTEVIDAPDNYTGGANDPVPGAVVTYTMTYTNESVAAVAQNVIIIDRITTKESTSGTNLAHVNATGDQGNVTISAAQGTATGWTVSYSTVLTSDTTYGATAGWTQIGSVGPTEYPGSGLYETGSSEYSAVMIKWEKASVAGAEDDTLTWGVTIR